MIAQRGLGKFEKVNIRQIWPKEDEDFTPWLFENISELGDALGLELEAQEQESPVGAFRLDVLASEAGTDHFVVIENQYGETDHAHLGQLLTYAAGFDAKVVVWIAERFREEHSTALNLLNNTGADTQFFGVRIEAWKIDNSRPAPRFDVVAAPNNWAKVAKARTHGQVTELGEKYRNFFQPLVDTLRDNHNFTKRTNATDWSWESFSSSHSGLVYGSWLGVKKHRVELYINKDKASANKEVFDELRAQKNSIQSALGERLNWERLDDKKASRISVQRDGGIYDEDRHDEIREWMVDRLLKFKEVFGPLLDEL